MNKFYPNWLVPIELAEELKTIGFDKRCHFYISYGVTDDSPDVIKSSHFNDFKRNDNYNLIKGCTSLPAWSQVFDWFVEKGLYCIIRTKDMTRYFDDPLEWSYRIYTNINNDDKVIFESDNYYYYPDYESAREGVVRMLIVEYGHSKINKDENSF